MIIIRNVRGNVALFDQTASYLQPAIPGLQLQPGHDYLVATDGGSEATILKGGTVTTVAPGEWYLVTKRGEVRKGKHRERGELRLFIGRLWALVARENKDLNLTGNATIGVRG